MITESRAVQHLQGINIRDEYGTPKKPYFQAHIDYKIFPSLDVCTNHKNAKTRKYFTKSDDALTKEWDQDFFMNPPYSRVDEFMKYAYEQHIKHNVNGLILTYSKTDTHWWHKFVEGKAEVHFIEGRIRFNDEDGIPSMMWSKKLQKFIPGVAPYPSVWIIYRKK